MSNEIKTPEEINPVTINGYSSLQIASMPIEQDIDTIWIRFEDYKKTIEPLQEQLKQAQESLGITEIELRHKTTLLASCETALAERDTQLTTSQNQSKRLEDALEAVMNEYNKKGQLLGFDVNIARSALTSYRKESGSNG